MICEKINFNLSCKILKYMCKSCSEISKIYIKEINVKKKVYKKNSV